MRFGLKIPCGNCPFRNDEDGIGVSVGIGYWTPGVEFRPHRLA
jgi:hypothetical protein